MKRRKTILSICLILAISMSVDIMIGASFFISTASGESSEIELVNEREVVISIHQESARREIDKPVTPSANGFFAYGSTRTTQGSKWINVPIFVRNCSFLI